MLPEDPCSRWAAAHEIDLLSRMPAANYYVLRPDESSSVTQRKNRSWLVKKCCGRAFRFRETEPSPQTFAIQEVYDLVQNFGASGRQVVWCGYEHSARHFSPFPKHSGFQLLPDRAPVLLNLREPRLDLMTKKYAVRNAICNTKTVHFNRA